jgi:hypothetical protein
MNEARSSPSFRDAPRGGAHDLSGIVGVPSSFSARALSSGDGPCFRVRGFRVASFFAAAERRAAARIEVPGVPES